MSLYIEPLTDREMDILRLKVQRQSNKEIAKTLFLSHNTVRWYISQIYSKINVKNRSDLIKQVNALGLLDIEDQEAGGHSRAEDAVLFETLTRREQEILHLLNQGLTNDQIAVSLTIALGTVKSHVHHICQKLDVKNRMQAVIRAKQLGLLNQHESFQLNVQQQLPKRWTSFIGRQTEIYEITQAIKHTRLLTLTGTGGTGKTRLAIAIAEQLKQQYHDGVFFIDLASIHEPSAVANAIANVLGLLEHQSQPLEEIIKMALQERQILMILDNFEHVLSASRLVTNLLQATTDLTILITSREALRIYGEYDYGVQPLPVPTKDEVDNEAVQLFVQRAQAVNRRLHISQDNVKLISEICRQLDGLPLAIELAAARCKTLTPSTILDRLDKRLNLLTTGARDLPQRQQTIRNTIAWSYDLLTSDEKKLFIRLSIFRGGRNIEACDAIGSCDLDLDILDGLSSLVNKSLLIQREDRLGEPRFYMLETIQEFASEQLTLAGETNMILTRHADYFAQLAETNEMALRGANQRYWFERFEIEMDNIRVALRYTLIDKGQPEVGVRLFCALFDIWWWWNAHHSEANRWSQIALEYENVLPPILLAKLYVMVGYGGWRLRRDFETCYHYARMAHEISIKLHDKWLMAWTLRYMGGSYIVIPQELATKDVIETAIDYVLSSVNLFHEIGDRSHEAHSYNALGQLYSMLGQYDRALECHERCIELSYSIQDLHRVQMNLMNVSRQTKRLGDIQKSKRIAREALVLAREISSPYMLVMSILDVAAFAKPHKSTHLLSKVSQAINQFGTTFQVASEEYFDNMVDRVQSDLDEKIYERLWAEGQTLSIAEAVAYALDEIDPFTDSFNET